MSVPPESPTQEFNSSENRAVSMLLGKPHSHTIAPEHNLSGDPGGPADLDYVALNEAFRSASITSPCDTRLLLSFPSWTEMSESAVVRLDREIGTWGLVGVVQRTRDVHFAVKLPVYNSPDEHLNPRLSPFHVRFDIYYDPGRDSCVLQNKIGFDIYLDSLDSQLIRTCIQPRGISAVNPGLWRISWGDNHVLDMLVLRRRFAVSIYDDPKGSNPRKRKTHEETINVADIKRSKPEKEENMEILLLPSTELPTVTKTETEMPSSTTMTLTRGTPLLQLQDGDTCLVRTEGRSSDMDAQNALTHFRGSSSAMATTPWPAIYEVSHLGQIATTRAVSVFAARHTTHVENVVAKVIKYTGESPEDLIHYAKSWLREVRILQRLRHKHVLSLKSSDGRLFALYVEHLPRSLQRGEISPFTASDAYTILHDISSALDYLKQKRIVHNDIKPANITYSPQRGAVLIDFGLATTEDQATSNGGSPWYVPPEYMRRGLSRNPCGDVWALGVTMLYVFAKIPLPETSVPGWLIRDAADEDTRAQKQMSDWIERVGEVREQLDVTETAERILFRMLEANAKRRIQATQIIAAFGDFHPAREPIGEIQTYT